MVQIISTHTLTPAPFADEVHDMGDFVGTHPEILGDDVQIVSRELEHGTDGQRLDFLVYDTESNQPGLVELKKSIADEKVLLQTLRYADWLRSNPDTIRYQMSRQQFDLDPDDVEGDIKIYIVAPRILPVVAELAQYIQGFEFAFIQLERFQGTDGEYLAVITPLEVPNRTAPRTRARLDHDWQTYRSWGVSEERLEELDAAVERLVQICEKNGWPLTPRKLKYAIKFQTGGGRNVFAIGLRKRDDHRLRFCLGADFNLEDTRVPESIRQAMLHKPRAKWWGVPIKTASLETYEPLLASAYEFVTRSS